MGKSIIKQPNGLYALWSSVVDNFVGLDFTREQLVDALTADSRVNHEALVNRVCGLLDENPNVFGPNNLNWESCLEERRTRHGITDPPEIKPI